MSKTKYQKCSQEEAEECRTRIFIDSLGVFTPWSEWRKIKPEGRSWHSEEIEFRRKING